jgi:hypothetical protein
LTASMNFWTRFKGSNWRSSFTTESSGSNGYGIVMEITTRNQSDDSNNDCQIIVYRPTATPCWFPEMDRPRWRGASIISACVKVGRRT